MAEIPNIIQILYDVIRVGLPLMEGAPRTYLTADTAAAAVTLTVADNSDFSNNDYLVLGSPGNDKTEIVKIGAAVTPGTALTISAAVFAHPANTSVTLIRYNQVAIYGSASATDAAPTIIGSATGLDVNNGYNEIKAATTYTYYYARFYNAQTTTYSAYSTAVAATGITKGSVADITQAFLRYVKEPLSADGLTKETILAWVNDWQDDVQLARKYWDFTRKEDVSNSLVQDKMRYVLPTDMQNVTADQSILRVWVRNFPPLRLASTDVWDVINRSTIMTTLAANVGLADVTISLTNAGDFESSGSIRIAGDTISYTGVSGNTLTGVTGISATHTSGDEVHQNTSFGLPYWYRIFNGNIEIYPVPSSSYANRLLHLDYVRQIPVLTGDQSVSIIPFAHISKYWLASEWYENKNTDLAERNRKLYQLELAGAKSKEPPIDAPKFEPKIGYETTYQKREFDQVSDLGWRNT